MLNIFNKTAVSTIASIILLGAVNSAVAAEFTGGKIIFKGIITDETCKVQVNNESGDTTVPLDTIGRSKLGAINTVNSTPVGKFDITVSGCDFTKLTPAPANKSVAIGFTQSDSIDNSTGTLKRLC